MERRVGLRLPEITPIIPNSAAPFHRPGWVYEKVDAWRTVAYKHGAHVSLMGRRGDHHDRFPDLAEAIAALPGDHLILAGEVAIYDQQRVSRLTSYGLVA